MSLFEALRVAISGLMANRMRAILTALGIIIGVGAVISLMSIGGGVQDYIANQFKSLGTNLLVVFPQAPSNQNKTRIEKLTTLQAAALADPSIAPSIRAVASQYMLSGEIKAGSESHAESIAAVSVNIVDVRSMTLRDGAFFTEDDVLDATRVAVLGVQVVKDLYGDKNYNPVGQKIRINDREFSVIGVLSESGGGFTGDDSNVFIPITTGQTRLTRARTSDGGYEVNVLWISAKSEQAMTTATREIEDYLNKAHKIQFAGDQDFQVANQADVLKTIGAVTNLLTIFLAMVASISLVVGGIGIMNIMLVSVTERTREVGLRKAVGASGRDIMLQFLIESIILSLIGGALGVGIGFAVTVIGNSIARQAESTFTLSLSIGAIVLATGVSSFVGIFFGLYPASRAARMRPIEALRYE